MGALFDSCPLRYDLFSHPIQFFIGFSMLVQFFTIRLAQTVTVRGQSTAGRLAGADQLGSSVPDSP